MLNGKSKFLVELILLTVLSFLIFISCNYNNFIFDKDGLKISTMIVFVLSVDICIYVYRNIYKK